MTVLINPSMFAEAGTIVDLVADFAGDWDAWLHYYGVETPVGSYQLNVPAGSYSADRFAAGNSKAIIQGAGIDQTLVFISGVSQQGTDHGLVPRIDSVSAGSTTITLKVPAQHTKFTEGWWYCIMGWAMQNFGFPPNNQFFEWRRFDDINTITGVITLDAPLENSYSDAWPAYTVGSDATFDSDTGGPACASYYISGNFDTNNPIVGEFHTDRQWWDMELVIRDLTITNGGGDIWFGQGNTSILWERVAFNGFAGDASGSPSWTLRDCVYRSSTIEIDKGVTELAFYNTDFNNDNGGIGAGILFQSSSVKHLTMDGCTFLPTGQNCALGARTFDAIDCTFGPLVIGSTSYGASESGSITDCYAFSARDASNRFIYPVGMIIGVDGVITIPYSSIDGTDAQLDITPGTACTLGAAGGGGGDVYKCFNVISVEKVGSNVLYTTDLPASLPEATIAAGISPHACPSITISGCTGALLPYNGTTNQPMFERASITRTGSDAGVSGASLYGTIVSITIDVSQAYTGVQGTVKMCPIGQFGAIFLYDGAHNVVGAQYQPNINLKVAGTRVIMPGSTTGTQAGDSIPAMPAGDNWLIGGGLTINFFPHINNGSIGTALDISGESAAVRPIVTVTIVCDQGL